MKKDAARSPQAPSSSRRVINGTSPQKVPPQQNFNTGSAHVKPAVLRVLETVLRG
jgi:hypothetical protein